MKRFSIGLVRAVLFRLVAIAFICGYGAGEAFAQTTGTNTVTLVSDNITNASNVATPLVIGISVIFIVWRLIKRIAAKAG